MSEALLKKLNWKAPAEITVLNAPTEFRTVVEGWRDGAKVKNRLSKNRAFVLAFVRSAAEVADRAVKVASVLDDDGVLWMAYPKKSSKRYTSDLNRDIGWGRLGDLGFEPVRQVSLNDDWSALRFRRVEKIATMNRDPAGAISKQGRAKASKARRAPDDPAVDRFIAALPDERRHIIEEAHRTIRAAAPALAPAMWQAMSKDMIGYGTYHYRSVSGREGEWFVIGLANQKRYVSLYICAAIDGRYLAEDSAGRLGKVSVGKSCVRFTKIENLDLEVTSELISRAAEAVEDGHFGM